MHRCSAPIFQFLCTRVLQALLSDKFLHQGSMSLVAGDHPQGKQQAEAKNLDFRTFQFFSVARWRKCMHKFKRKSRIWYANLFCRSWTTPLMAKSHIQFRFYRRLVRHVLKQAQWLPFDIADLEVSKGKYNMQIIILWYVIAMGNCHACDC